jgi:hypothetical protein
VAGVSEGERAHREGVTEACPPPFVERLVDVVTTLDDAIECVPVSNSMKKRRCSRGSGRARSPGHRSIAAERNGKGAAAMEESVALLAMDLVVLPKGIALSLG